MVRKLEPTVREYLYNDVPKQFVRIEEVSEELGLTIEETQIVLIPEVALTKLPYDEI